MFDARKFLSGVSVVAILSFAAASISYAGDEPKASADAAKPAPDAGHIMMDHSIGDTKSMSMMKDKSVPVHHSGDAPKAAGRSKCQDHIVMDHSIGDPKSMSMMKDKTVPIHNPCKPTAKSTDDAAPVDHIMMDHSIGDTKSMSMMKDKKVPIHHSGVAEKPAAESPSK